MTFGKIPGHQFIEQIPSGLPLRNRQSTKLPPDSLIDFNTDVLFLWGAGTRIFVLFSCFHNYLSFPVIHCLLIPKPLHLIFDVLRSHIGIDQGRLDRAVAQLLLCHPQILLLGVKLNTV